MAAPVERYSMINVVVVNKFTLGLYKVNSKKTARVSSSNQFCSFFYFLFSIYVNLFKKMRGKKY